jgi:benzoate membrane transport protein
LTPAALIGLSVPLVAITLGVGAVQGIGVLRSQGFEPPTRTLAITLGLTSVVNAFFGGHTTSIQSNGVAILAGPDAGPRERRYVACLIASTYVVALALCATTAGSLLGVLPYGLVASLAGLAVLSSLMEALKKTVVTDLPMGAFFALVIATSPLQLLGIGSPLWALVGGLLVSLVLERPALRRAWASAPTERTGGAVGAPADFAAQPAAPATPARLQPVVRRAA